MDNPVGTLLYVANDRTVCYKPDAQSGYVFLAFATYQQALAFAKTLRQP